MKEENKITPNQENRDPDNQAAETPASGLVTPGEEPDKKPSPSSQTAEDNLSSSQEDYDTVKVDGDKSENPKTPPNTGKSEKESSSVIKKVVGSRNGRIVIIAILAVIVLAVLFNTHVLCFHEWEPATCTRPETCTICNRTRGEALGHDWVDATCTEPKTCTRCGKTEGDPLGHNVEEWKTTKKATCTEEGEKQGICTRCGENITESIAKTDHSYGDWTVTKEATCSEEGSKERTCSQCGEKETDSIAKIDHKPGSWETTSDFVLGDGGYVEPGEQVKKCSVCGQVVETRPYTVELTLEQQNAVTTALDYIDFMAFSRSGLIDQLEYEGYSSDDATLVVDHIGVDWNQQAEFMAQQYLDTMSFSRDGLIEQLEYEGFSHDQAVHGVDKAGL